MEVSPKIVVIGLGYVGLPVAVALAKHFDVLGYDIDIERKKELKAGYDRTFEITAEDLAATSLEISVKPEDCRNADVYIVTVPTPVASSNQPDLSAVVAATQMIGRVIDPKRRPTIVLESTVYPGVTEEICGGELQRMGHVRGEDFRLAYCPERINPGDKKHTIEKIIKVVSGEDEEVVELLARIYGAITTGGVFRAASIKTAEAAKAIENAQRDINIAFVNEATQVFSKIGVSMWDVLDVSRTKWNFLPFEPGLVGGHCIGVDPYYLSYLAEKVGTVPRVILAGRTTNDGMSNWIADQLHAERGAPGTALVLGLTFKENVPDTRNSRSFDLVRRLRSLGHKVDVADPLASAGEIKREHGLKLVEPKRKSYDLVVGAVHHQVYRNLTDAALLGLCNPGATIADLRGMWRDRALGPEVRRWTL